MDLPDALATGSSRMPQKQNPDELAAKGIPFREAHERVSRERGHSSDLNTVLAKKNVYGGTAPDRVREAAHKALESLTCHPERSEGSPESERPSHIGGGSFAVSAAQDDTR